MSARFKVRRPPPPCYRAFQKTGFRIWRRRRRSAQSSAPFGMPSRVGCVLKTLRSLFFCPHSRRRHQQRLGGIARIVRTSCLVLDGRGDIYDLLVRNIVNNFSNAIFAGRGINLEGACSFLSLPLLFSSFILPFNYIFYFDHGKIRHMRKQST